MGITHSNFWSEFNFGVYLSVKTHTLQEAQIQFQQISQECLIVLRKVDKMFFYHEGLQLLFEIFFDTTYI
jgi:hypothetical protein